MGQLSLALTPCNWPPSLFFRLQVNTDICWHFLLPPWFCSPFFHSCKRLNTMSKLTVVLTLLCVLCISLGQVLFKKAASSLPSVLTWQAFAFNGWLVSSLALYGLTTLGWVWILRNVPLHLAYPFMGLAFLIVPTLAWIFLGEPLHWRTLAGGALILAGVALAAS